MEKRNRESGRIGDIQAIQQAMRMLSRDKQDRLIARHPLLARTKTDNDDECESEQTTSHLSEGDSREREVARVMGSPGDG